MIVRSSGPKGVFSKPFGLSALVFVLAPTQIGYQDVASLLIRQPAVTAHWRQHVRASAFGTVQASTFSFSRPIGTAMPQPLSYRLASVDPRQLMMGSPFDDPRPDDPQLQFPKVDRSAKGDRLPRTPQPEPIAVTPDSPPARAEATPVLSNNPQESDLPSQKLDIPAPLEQDGMAAETADFAPPKPIEPVMEMARLYFGNEPLGDESAKIEQWAPGEAPTIVPPAIPADPDIKLSAFHPPHAEETKSAPDKIGESVASKGEVTGEGRRPLSPAERLGLDGKARTKAEKCLADAIYFESRGEPVRGQMAVAQVVMNRVFSGYYPRNVCATVYQNAHRRLACQFTFACDGIPDIVTEPQAWVRAVRIAKDTLDGEFWVPEVKHATHYHAYWVRPSWVREMAKLYKYGVDTFYRPRAWGDGSDAPSWGNTAATAEATAKL